MNSATIDEPLGISLHVHELLSKHRMIAAIWSIEDVQEVRPDLNDDQAWEVLQEVEHRHDASIGITWAMLELFADDLFPLTTSE
jgi:hypothetical protein